jgi:sulfur-carrier protein
MSQADPTTEPARVKVILPRALIALFPEATTTVHLNAATVEDILLELDARWPGMRDRLRDTSPAIRKHINIFVDGYRATLRTKVSPGDEVYILTAMSGG